MLTGSWSNWADEAECPVRCGGGQVLQHRQCVGGYGCLGAGSRRVDCNTRACSGGYTEYGSWSECTEECGGGIQTRSR